MRVKEGDSMTNIRSFAHSNVRDEGFVVYLFSLFHRELGFDHIVQMQTKFPDCTAVKEGKEVSIEFQKTSNELSEHLAPPELGKSGIIWRNLPNQYKVLENEEEIVVERGSERAPLHFPKSEYDLYTAQDLWEIRKRTLNLDYCVCWKVNHDPSYLEKEYNQVKFIELRTQPIVVDFMEKRRDSLMTLGIKDLAIREESD